MVLCGVAGFTVVVVVDVAGDCGLGKHWLRFLIFRLP